MERNIMGELSIYRQSGIKPNFSGIARRHGMDRKTVARYWRSGGDVDDGRALRESAFAPYDGLIREKAQIPGITKRAIYEFILDRHGGDLPKYGAFTKYCRGAGIAIAGPGAAEPHPRFETPPGRQMQFDWKEDLRMVDANGEAFEFNVFTATLGYSRLHKFTYAPTRTADELLSCLLGTFKFMGGIPQECLTDNMSSLVSMSSGRRTRSERVWRFAGEGQNAAPAEEAVLHAAEAECCPVPDMECGDEKTQPVVCNDEWFVADGVINISVISDIE